jgi:regulator of RNase E activity RraA
MSDPLVRRLCDLDACAVSDALDSVSVHGVIVGLHGLSVARKVAGRAVTVRLVLVADAPVTSRHLGTSAVELSGPDEVIVVDHDGRTDVAGWGGILSLAASVRGVAGVVVDGAVRDVDEACQLGFPIYARAAVAVTARGRVAEAATNEPVQLCGVTIRAGDYVVADRSGVVAIPAEVAGEIIAAAECIAGREAHMAGDIRAGRPVSEVMGADYESMLNDGSTHG